MQNPNMIPVSSIILIRLPNTSLSLLMLHAPLMLFVCVTPWTFSKSAKLKPINPKMLLNCRILYAAVLKVPYCYTNRLTMPISRV